MRRSSTIVVGFGLALASLHGCGGAGAVNFFDAEGGSAGRNASAAGASSVAGARAVASAGAASAGETSPASAGETSPASAGETSTAGAGTNGPSDTPCSPVIDVTDHGTKMSGEFQTEGPVCLFIAADIAGWGCSNFEGRTLKVNGVDVSCADLPLPDKLQGGYYFDISAGNYAYASVYWY